MKHKLKIFLRQTDHNIRYVLGERTVEAYKSSIKETDTQQQTELKLIRDYFQQQPPEILQYLLKIYLFARHIIAVVARFSVGLVVKDRQYE